MNFFETRTAAERFARGRPFFHPLVIDRVREYLSLNKPLGSVLDIGCGTGLSTKALKEIASSVAAMDLSHEMISFAQRDNTIHYLVASGETLPFGNDAFDLITISQVFHWLDRRRFFAEVSKVLKDTGWLIVYDNYISDEMTDNPRYSPWFREVFLAKYPTPPRNWAAFDPADTEKDGFFMANSEIIKNTISFTLDSFVDFLLTLTNVIAAVEGGRENVFEAAKWLTNELDPSFRGEESFIFTAPIWFLTSSPRQASATKH
jgi:SAM-dependent methyltransferase